MWVFSIFLCRPRKIKFNYNFHQSKKAILFWKITNVVPMKPPKRKLLEILPNKAVISTKFGRSKSAYFSLSLPKCTHFTCSPEWLMLLLLHLSSLFPPSYATLNTCFGMYDVFKDSLICFQLSEKLVKLWGTGIAVEE